MADAPTRVRLLAADLYLRRAPLRIPFHFGNAVLTELELVSLRVQVDVAGCGVTQGASESVLAPLWFDKDPTKPLARRRAELLASVRRAADAMREQDAASLVELHREAAGAVAEGARAAGAHELVASFGVALVEMALVDALCRAQDTTLHVALREDLLGLGPAFAAHLPERPPERIAVRHTVGMGDPLTGGADVTDPLDDGLPQTLEEVLRETGGRYFKLKIPGDPEAAVARMAQVAEVLDAASVDYRLTVDGNEQFGEVDTLAAFVALSKSTPALADAWARTLWIEQPMGRDETFDPAIAEPLAAIAADKPVVIDEADATDDALERALELGYSGSSAKTCKGILRVLRAQRVIGEWNASGRRPAVLAGEDLTCVPLLGLHQDSCVAASLGIAHLERNGHHYVRGAAHLSAPERTWALKALPALYRPLADGTPALRIEGGSIDATQLCRHAFGADFTPDWDAREALE
jgi:hypothetical protein